LDEDCLKKARRKLYEVGACDPRETIVTSMDTDEGKFLKKTSIISALNALH